MTQHRCVQISQFASLTEGDGVELNSSAACSARVRSGLATYEQQRTTGTQPSWHHRSVLQIVWRQLERILQTGSTTGGNKHSHAPA